MLRCVGHMPQVAENVCEGAGGARERGGELISD